MKKSLVLAMAMALGVTASAYAANPFSDVPAGHWAYDAVNKLAAAGVVDGYPDGTYGGDKLMTRYEMAQIVAKAMAKGANVDKLAAEFADELDSLGVRVANLEKKADNVKVTGAIKYDYASFHGDYDKTNNHNRLRTDIWVTGQVNDDWTYTGMIRNEQFFSGNDNDGNPAGNKSEESDVRFQRAYVNGKLGGLAVQAGRYNFTDFTGGNIHDNRIDGGQLSYGKDVKLTAGYGKATDANKLTAADTGLDNNLVYAGLDAKLGAVKANVGYYKFDDLKKVADDDTIWTAGLGFDLAKNLAFSGYYLKSNADKAIVDGTTYNDVDDDGYVLSLDYKGAKASEAGSWGLGAKYYDQGAGTVVAHTMDGLYFNEGFKGYMVNATYTFAKNIVGGVYYYDLESKETDDAAQTLWSQVVFSF